jgi:hypothetical protein
MLLTVFAIAALVVAPTLMAGAASAGLPVAFNAVVGVLLLAAALILVVLLAISEPSGSRRRAKRRGGNGGSDDYGGNSGGGFRRVRNAAEGTLQVFRLLVRIPALVVAILMAGLLRMHLFASVTRSLNRRPRDHPMTMSQIINGTGDRGGSLSRASPAGILAA